MIVGRALHIYIQFLDSCSIGKKTHFACIYKFIRIYIMKKFWTLLDYCCCSGGVLAFYGYKLMSNKEKGPNEKQAGEGDETGEGFVRREG